MFQFRGEKSLEINLTFKSPSVLSSLSINLVEGSQRSQVFNFKLQALSSILIDQSQTKGNQFINNIITIIIMLLFYDN